ncbi:RagB/SusD family nutrient uptake outer membrane protein [soil metagenome]
MKIKNILFGLGLTGGLLLSACQSVIEVEPEFARDGSQIFTNLDDYEFALTGAYAGFRGVGYFGNGAQTTASWGVLPDMMSDNLVQTPEDLANWQDQVNWVYTTDESDIAVAWQSAYYIVTQANLVLRNIDQFATTDATRLRANRLKGQALAIRGMVHFDLLRYWGESFDRNSPALGVPYKTVVDAEDMPARLSVKDTYDNIFRDLQEAETLLGDVDRAINSNTNRGRIDQLGVRAILARANLYAKNYVAAENYATLVINSRPLATRAQFPGIWTDANVSEVIWAVTFSAGEGSPSFNVHVGSSNRNRYRPSAALEATFDQANDIRFPSYFGSRTSAAGASRRIVQKYMSRGTTLDNLVDWKAFRVGEMYLIRAEARAMQGAAGAVGALADLNALRAARITGYMPAVLTGQALQDAIALERRKELFAEGHRWFDLKRTTRTVNRTEADLPSTIRTLLPGAREWVWPIPQGEIDANPNIASQQSPGYN